MNNRVILKGTVYTSPEVHINAQHEEYVRFVLRVQENYQNLESILRSRVDWFVILVWRPDLIEICRTKLQKNMAIFIEGSLVSLIETNPQDLYVNVIEVQLSRRESVLQILG